MNDATTPRSDGTEGYPNENGRNSPTGVAAVFSAPTEPGDLGRLGDYRILRQLGKGGMGEVFLAEDTRLGRPVALKFIAPSLAHDEKSRARFLREARAAARIQHRNVVVIYEVNEANGLPYIAMERLKGLSMEDYLTKNGPPTLPHALRIMREVAGGLGAAHAEGVIHRDVKPANIWLEAPSGRVRLVDFGLAFRPESDKQLTTAGIMLGTPAYMAPEQARGSAVDHRADLFSLGVVLYRLCTGQFPFTGTDMMAVLISIATDTPTPVRSHNPSLPVALELLINRLLAKNPNDRPESAAAVIAALGSIAADKAPSGTSGARPTATAAPPPPGADVSALPSWLDPTAPSPPGAGVTSTPKWLTTPSPDKGLHSNPPHLSPSPLPPSDRSTVPSMKAKTSQGPSPVARPSERMAPPPPPAASPPAWPPSAPPPTPPGAPPAHPDFSPQPFGGHPSAPVAPVINVSVTNTSESKGNQVRVMNLPRADRVPVKSDPAGTATVILGVVSLVCMFFCLCGGYWLAAPLAVGGIVAGIFARGGMRVAGLILNGIVLIPAVVVMIIGAAFFSALFGISKSMPTGPAPSPPITNKQGPNPAPKSPEYGVPATKLPEPGAPAPGTLQLNIPHISAIHQNLELFIDGTIEETFTRSWSEKFTLRLPPKEHTVLFKKNGIEVYSKTVTVKKSTEGITFLDIDLIVTGSIILKSNRPVSPGVVAHVFVDNVSVKRWPVGADSVELLVDVGSRVVEVRTTEPMQAVVFKSTVLIDQPGTQKVLMVKN